ncbi:hypothetical protein BCR39DRAFT_540979 [Naematelia encephala]|uniref:Uncharacterized protein n=1 Tax=Naematelia encephala TaxID=71784 RepID=A0A1Y2AW81_9TREE|nr:hypothetical protein BCR39DRAFT_540979 [Naematelia encephala]
MSRSNEKERNPTNNGKKQTKINGQDQTMINGQDRRTINGQEHDSIESEQDELLSSQPRPRPPLSFNSTSNSTGTSDVSDLIPSSPIPSIIPASSVITSLGQRRLKKSKLNKGKDEFSTPIPTPTPTPTSTTVRGDEGGSGEVDKSSRRKSRRSSLKQVRKGPTWVTGTPGIGDA